jgi:hypothetical protein
VFLRKYHLNLYFIEFNGIDTNWDSFSCLLGNHIECGALLQQNIQEKCGVVEADLAKIGPSSKVIKSFTVFSLSLDPKLDI